jgi:hypothetical protein
MNRGLFDNLIPPKLPEQVQAFVELTAKGVALQQEMLNALTAMQPKEKADFHTERYHLLTAAYGRASEQRLKIVKLTVTLTAAGTFVLWAGEGNPIFSGRLVGAMTQDFHWPVADGAPIDIARGTRLYLTASVDGDCWIDALAE